MSYNFLIALLVSSSFYCFGQDLQRVKTHEALKNYSYPHFTDNALITPHMRNVMFPYLLPKNHKLKRTLDSIFSQEGVIKNEKTIRKAGFTVLFSQKRAWFINDRNQVTQGIRDFARFRIRFFS